MSNIFYSEVDKSLQKELNARGESGKTNRTTDALNFMLGKIANGVIFAHEGNDASTTVISELGGASVRSGRYLPSGPNGYLNESPYTSNSIEIVNGIAANKIDVYTDRSRRTGPFITNLNVSIGDHSMGLLNKAVINISVPNPARDLNDIEDTWLRPGRFCSLVIAHPESAIVSKKLFDNAGFLTKKTLPKADKLKRLFPNIDTDKILNDISKLNEFRFEGLITSFDMSYQATGVVDITLYLTGTSNVYTDVSMYLKTPETQQQNPLNTSIKYDAQLDAPSRADMNAVLEGNTDATTVPKPEFYHALYNQFEIIRSDAISRGELADRCFQRFYTSQTNTSAEYTDRFILYGEPYNPTQGAQPADISQTNYNRYITLGALVEFINTYVVTKMDASVKTAQIVCSDLICVSNYYEHLVSCTPDDVLLYSKNIASAVDMSADMRSYGTLQYYPDPTNEDIFPGVYEKTSVGTPVIYPSRILLSLEMIETIIAGPDGKGGLTEGGTKSFSLKTFMKVLSSKISYATGKAIVLDLITHPDDPTMLLYTDIKYLKNSDGTVDSVEPYSVPMFADHPYGTIVRDFSFNATLPESAKNLSYVLNSGDDVSEESIAPYLNYMYNAKNADSVNRILEDYRNKHKSYIDELERTKTLFGQAPGVDSLIQSLYKSLTSYIKFPKPDILESQQITAPIFPFDVEFTIDGINGLKYGDVLTFHALPDKYKINTVFSIISLTHDLTANGEWTTRVKCIMRPNIS